MIFMKSSEITWIDIDLKIYISLALNKNEFEITKEFLDTLTHLDLSDKNISNLSGIEYCTNLKYLNLSRNNIRCAYLIGKLRNLTTLILNENKIQDISFVSKLPLLITLELESNDIKEIPNLDNCTNLKLIDISNNRVDNIYNIVSLNNKKLDIIAKDQSIYLNCDIVDISYSYIFENPIFIDGKNFRILDNVQVNGDCIFKEIDKVPYLKNSVSKVKIDNILSDCQLRCNFIYEASSSVEIIYSGTIFKTIMCKGYSEHISNEDCNILYGNIKTDQNKDLETNLFKDKRILLIQSDGTKIQGHINTVGFYEFLNLTKGKYTILFPYLYGYKYITPSLFIINLKGDECIELNPSICKV